MKCYACGEELRDTAKFCESCGADQSKRPAEECLCSRCGAPIAPDDHFCVACGASQTPSAPEPEGEMSAISELASLPDDLSATDSPAAEEVAECVAAPETVAEPEPIPVVIPDPEPAPAVIPDPEPAPAVIPDPESAPAAIPEPAPRTSPRPIPQPAPAPQPVPQPVYQQPQQTYQQQQRPVYQQPQQPVYQQPNYHNPYQPGYQPNPYQSAYQPQQNIQVNLSGAAPQRPAAPMFLQAQPPAYQLPCERGLLKMILLSMLTCGIYPLAIYSRISMEINMVASQHDGKRTMHYLWMCFLAPLTLMIYPFVWIHGLCNRMGGELYRRQINYKFSGVSFWLWNLVYGFVGALITAVTVYVLYAIVILDQALVILIGSALLLASLVGPLVFVHKMMKAMNLINADYNRRG